MTRKRKFTIIAAALAVGVVAGLIFTAPSLQRSFFYPRPRNLPPVVSSGTEQLLAKLQLTLETNAPAVVHSLQPGLSETQISALEAQGRFRLSADLRALYRWHNGMTTNTTLGLLPGQRFLPLEECVAERAMIGQQKGAAYAVFVGHRKSWVHVLDDGAGDGYFFDPEREETGGAFFYHMAESGYYIWFPSFRNFLSGVIECYETRCVKTLGRRKESRRGQLRDRNNMAASSQGERVVCGMPNETRQPTPEARLGCVSAGLARRGCAVRSATSSPRMKSTYFLAALALLCGLLNCRQI